MVRGVARYVIVGAGMDSFAFRRPELLERLDVFEIDEPAMQQTKRDRLERPAVPGRSWTRTGTYYLKPETLARLLGSIAVHLAPDTGVVVDYLLDGEPMSAGQRHLRQRPKAFVARRGEPMFGTYSRSEMSALAATANLAEVEGISLIDLQRR